MWHLLFSGDNWLRSPEIFRRALGSGMWLDKKVTRGIGDWSYPLTKGNHVSNFEDFQNKTFIMK
jgi:hypothetical protein